jgi:hypothetical protein
LTHLVNPVEISRGDPDGLLIRKTGVKVYLLKTLLKYIRKYSFVKKNFLRISGNSHERKRIPIIPVRRIMKAGSIFV